jgi:predicted ATPase
LLKGGRDAEPRQQTLRATIDWSHELLSEEERRLFRRLSVFTGGCTYVGAEEVCGAGPDTLQSLIDKSLLRRRDTDFGARYWMLETIHDFAAERLRAEGEAQDVRRSHADYFLEQLEQVHQTVSDA